MPSARRRTSGALAVLALGATLLSGTGPAAVDVSSLATRAADGRVTQSGNLFTGVSERSYADGLLAERIHYVEGRKHGLAERWFADGVKSFRATYHNDRRHGVVKSWWEDGTPRSESRYASGVADGVQRQWYSNGALFKEVHLVAGQEEGPQRAWRENGKLYANYEARDGRIYGLKRSNLCYGLEDEGIVASVEPKPRGEAS